ncbi:hypothetical protein Cabys_2111 [Caldithrix abyssi DSM 13497]|uniref:Uncharacterized protein n=1 Tax=Caldithrix abyssi DSM 13497 TaxID=880073 RepID=A0A1J1C8Y1_CALAY|nr:hypothetical protein Cabys_2111 [Caldithrix abyssi DSM 13497]
MITLLNRTYCHFQRRERAFNYNNEISFLFKRIFNPHPSVYYLF